MANLKAIDERLAKIREEVERLEQARSLLSDPQMEQLLREFIASSPAPRGERPSLVSAPEATNSQRRRRPHGELRRRVLELLPNEDSTAPMSTKEIVRNLMGSGYTFQAKDPEMAVNAALVALEVDGMAMNMGDTGKRGKAKLWTKVGQGEV